MECLHAMQRDLRGWDDAGYEYIHSLHSDPDWVKHELRLRKEDKNSWHALQTYRLAVRQGCRERGIPVRLT